ncbi:MAG TPA: hypothetical protein VN436_13300, partial [Holophaga sp.]|nr:hypothetical protein [Holophaga sp.]
MLTPEERRARREWKREEQDKATILCMLQPRSRIRDPEMRRLTEATDREFAETLIKRLAEAAATRAALEGARMDLDAIGAIRYLIARMEELERRIAALESQVNLGAVPYGPAFPPGVEPFLHEVPPD